MKSFLKGAIEAALLVAMLSLLFVALAIGVKAQSTKVWSETHEMWALDCSVNKDIEFEGCGMLTKYPKLKVQGKAHDFFFYVARMKGDKVLIKFIRENGHKWPQKGKYEVRILWSNGGEATFQAMDGPTGGGFAIGRLLPPSKVWWQNLSESRTFSLIVDGTWVGKFALKGSADAVKRIHKKYMYWTVLGRNYNYKDSDGNRIDTF